MLTTEQERIARDLRTGVASLAPETFVRNKAGDVLAVLDALRDATARAAAAEARAAAAEAQDPE